MELYFDTLCTVTKQNGIKFLMYAEWNQSASKLMMYVN